LVKGGYNVTWLLPSGSKYIQKSVQEGFTPLVMKNLTEELFESFEEKARSNELSGKDVIMMMNVDIIASAFNDKPLIEKIRAEKYDMFAAVLLPPL